MPWRELETQGWIAEATCTEVRVALPEPLRMEYAVAEWRNKYRIASENPAKDDVVAQLLDQLRATSRVLIIGQYLKQLRQLAQALRHPADHRADAPTPSARTCTTSSAAARSGS